MKRVIATVIVAACTILVMSTCNLITPSDEEGEIRFDLGLLQPLQLGYEVTHARCTLQHQVSGTVVERDLDIEADTASALIRGLRIGWWDLSVELLEGDEVVGSAATEVEVRSGDTTRVVLQVELATGGLEIVVNWKNGIVILDFDLAELATAGYDIAEVDYVLTHNASGESMGGQIIPETEVAYVEVTELLVGTWNLEVAFWQPGGDNPLCTTQYDLDIGPGITEELNLDVVSLSPVEVVPIPYSAAEPYGWPDLKIMTFTGPATAAAGESIGPSVSVEITNDGLGVAAAEADDLTIYVSFYLSEFSYHGPFSEHLVSMDVITPIAADEIVTIAVPPALTIPESVESGSYYLIVVVDNQAEVEELNENNNTDAIAIAVGPRWTLETIDFDGGAYTSLALDSSNVPHISYQKGMWLGYATRQGDVWQTSWADDAGFDDGVSLGFYSSIATDSADAPHISYYDSGLGIVKYARWYGTTWEIESVGSANADYTSIDIDSAGVPHISYRSDALVHAYKRILSEWIIEAIGFSSDDTAPSWGHNSSVAVDSLDNVHVSHGVRNATKSPLSSQLHYAKHDGIRWSPEPVDMYQGVGLYTSIAVDSMDWPHIVYYNYRSQTLKYARWDGLIWRIETIDSAGDAGKYPSIALDSGDMPHVSYYQGTVGNLNYAYRDEVTWIVETVDELGDVGLFTSIAVDTADRPHISYYDETNDDLKYAHR